MSETPNFCPICRARIGAGDLLLGKCPACGQALPGAQKAQESGSAPYGGPQQIPYGVPRAPQPPGTGYGPAMTPPPPPMGTQYGWGPPVGPKGKNTIGIVALICGLAAVVLMALSVYGSMQAISAVEDEIVAMTKEMKSEMDAKGHPLTPQEQRALQEKYQKRLTEKASSGGFLGNLGCPAALVAVGAIVLGIIGLTRRGLVKGSSLGGLLLGITAGLILLVFAIVVAVNITMKMMEALKG